MFIRFDRIEERDRWTDGQTDEQTVHHGIGRAYAQHRAKKNTYLSRNTVFDCIVRTLSCQVHFQPN